MFLIGEAIICIRPVIFDRHYGIIRREPLWMQFRGYGITRRRCISRISLCCPCVTKFSEGDTAGAAVRRTTFHFICFERYDSVITENSRDGIVVSNVHFVAFTTQLLRRQW